MAHIYRFHETVAIQLGDQPTVYISPDEAELVADALKAFASDIRTTMFSESTLRSVHVPDNEERG